jgi:hypothetical protein
MMKKLSLTLAIQEQDLEWRLVFMSTVTMQETGNKVEDFGVGSTLNMETEE